MPDICAPRVTRSVPISPEPITPMRIGLAVVARTSRSRASPVQCDVGSHAANPPDGLFAQGLMNICSIVKTYVHTASLRRNENSRPPPPALQFPAPGKWASESALGGDA